MSDDILTPDDLGETPEYNNLFRNRDLTSFFLLHMTNDCSVEDLRHEREVEIDTIKRYEREMEEW